MLLLCCDNPVKSVPGSLPCGRSLQCGQRCKVNNCAAEKNELLELPELTDLEETGRVTNPGVLLGVPTA